MKYIYILLILGCFGLNLSAQNYSGHLKFENPKLKETEETLTFTFDFDVNKYTVGKKHSLFVIPCLQSENEIMYFPYIQVAGKTKNKALERSLALHSSWAPNYETPIIKEVVNKYTDKKVQYSVTVPYEEWMDNSKLSLVEELWSCAGEKRLFVYDLGLLLEREIKEPYKLQPIVSYVLPKQEKKARQEEGSAFLDFKVGQSVIIPDFRRNPEELASIRETIYKTQRDADITIDNIMLTGYASPEGSYSTNERLSRDRANALRVYIQNMMGISGDKIRLNTGGEDWVGLRKLVEESYMDNKALVLSIIDNSEGYDRKEQQLKNLSIYRWMLNELFPQLRRVEYKINYTVRDYDIVESRELFGKDPGRLSPYELFLLAGNYQEGSNEWNSVMELTVKLYPDNIATQINGAAVLLTKGEFEQAKALLADAEDIPAAWNNIGIYYLYVGDWDKAQEYFIKAIAHNIEEAKHNLDELQKAKKQDKK